eukprot:TRINITY_DN8582_c0_g1_i1.p1 TRINITY_DN8582_c0_g1~~TRINITY_DN8582_c0_g1_i1.p1  ORF type:complete len:235 (-),score=34.78 TRINITY_DN8582_c0_g1_i1:118-822(-)
MAFYYANPAPGFQSNIVTVNRNADGMCGQLMTYHAGLPQRLQGRVDPIRYGQTIEAMNNILAMATRKWRNLMVAYFISLLFVVSLSVAIPLLTLNTTNGYTSFWYYYWLIFIPLIIFPVLMVSTRNRARAQLIQLVQSENQQYYNPLGVNLIYLITDPYYMNNNGRMYWPVLQIEIQPQNAMPTSMPTFYSPPVEAKIDVSTPLLSSDFSAPQPVYPAPPAYTVSAMGSKPVDL